MAINIGDTVYILKDHLDCSLYQIKATLLSIETVRIGRVKVKFYQAITESQNYVSAFYKEYRGGGMRVNIRKRPMPNVPIEEY